MPEWPILGWPALGPHRGLDLAWEDKAWGGAGWLLTPLSLPRVPVLRTRAALAAGHALSYFLLASSIRGNRLREPKELT